MRRQQICFVSYLDQDNLGVGYMASALLQCECFAITLVDIREDTPTIIESIIDSEPLIVGFSIVFQIQLDTFRQLMIDLRENGVHSHFTAGGHYPSLRYEELMQLAPQLDSVVLFEGEHTIVELAKAIQTNSEWRDIVGLAYQKDGKTFRNALRPLENDLDRFPLPVRRTVRPKILGQNVVNLLAGRGCYYRCSFCSIHSFYSQPPGKVKRVRRPEYVVREMQLHYEQEGCSIFLFQDDDFPIWNTEGQEWIEKFCQHLRDRELADRVMWKISCRSNEVDEKVMSKMMAHGLGMVYLGIESGTIEGLELMNKHLTPEDSLTASQILKRMKLPFEFGFMMFDPYTTFDSLQKNVDFLLQLCGDGSASVGLAKMLALAGTEIEEALRSQGRLFGYPPYEDYRFLIPQLDECFAALSGMFRSWMHDERGVMNYSRWIRLQIEAFRRFCMRMNEAEDASRTLHDIVSSANQYLLRTVVSVADLVRSSSRDNDVLNKIHSDTMEKHNTFSAQLRALADHVDKLARVHSTKPN